MSAREVVTIQCGHFSNFVGTHWWNLQESGFCYDPLSREPREILHDCLFREGLTLTGQQTYTPRLIAIDLPGSLKTLREDGVLYDTAPRGEAGPVCEGVSGEGVWEGGVDMYETEPVPKNKYLTELERGDSEVQMGEGGDGEREKSYNLDSSVEVWTDFLRLHLHPKSLLMVPGHFHNDSQDTFAPFPAGLNVWDNKMFRTQLEDQLHFFVEECDTLQGFHLLCDWSNGFGGLGSCVAQDLRDEYGNKGILTFLSSPLDTPLDKLPEFYSLVLNHLLCVGHLAGPSSALVPLSLLSQPWLSPPSPSTVSSLSPSFNPALPYHTSALFASALETSTLFYRTHHNLTTLPRLTDTLTDRGRKICSLGVSLPFTLPPHGNLATQLSLSPLPSSLSPLSPFSHHHDNTIWSLTASLRGIPPNYPLSSAQDTHYSHPSHVLAVHLSETVPSVNSQLCCIQKPLPLAKPFPNILPDHLMKTGNTPTCATLQTHSGSKQLLLSLLSLLRPEKLKQFPAFSETCLDTDACSELAQNIATLADCYLTTGEPLSDEDSD